MASGAGRAHHVRAAAASVLAVCATSTVHLASAWLRHLTKGPAAAAPAGRRDGGGVRSRGAPAPRRRAQVAPAGKSAPPSARPAACCSWPLWSDCSVRTSRSRVRGLRHCYLAGLDKVLDAHRRPRPRARRAPSQPAVSGVAVLRSSRASRFRSSRTAAGARPPPPEAPDCVQPTSPPMSCSASPPCSSSPRARVFSPASSRPPSPVPVSGQRTTRPAARGRLAGRGARPVRPAAHGLTHVPGGRRLRPPHGRTRAAAPKDHKSVPRVRGESHCA